MYKFLYNCKLNKTQLYFIYYISKYMMESPL